MKNVLLVIGSSLENAGVPNVIMQIVRSLHKKYCFDIIVGNTNAGCYDDEFFSYGGNIFQYNKITYGEGKFKLLSSGKQIYEMVSQILTKKIYEIVHTHEGYLSGWVLKAAKEKNVPIRIAHSHGTYYNRGKNLPVRLFKLNSMKKITRYATKCVACSRISGQTLFMGQKFENILNPLDISPYLSLDKQPHDGINLIQIGYYCKLKNQLFSIEVLRQLLQRGVPAQLHFIGYDTGHGYQKKIENEIIRYRLQKQVHFHPSNTDKLALLPLMDYSLLPSASEGMPLTALEAQASHTYCITSTHVPKDCDMGMLTQLDVDGVDSVSVYADWIIKHQGYENTLDIYKLSKIDTVNWVKKIEILYNGAEII